MKIPVIVVGAGGHAKVVLDALLRGGVQVLGLVDADPLARGRIVLGTLVLGGDDRVLEHSPGGVLLVNGIGATGAADRRAAVHAFFHDRGYRFRTVVDPTAIVASEVELGEGCQVLAGAVIQPGCRIGADAVINTRAAVDHDCVIGAHAHVAPGATLSGGVRVGDGALVGTGAAIIQGITIGAAAVIGAGAAVVRDVAEGAIVVGVPARPLNSGG